MAEKSSSSSPSSLPSSNPTDQPLASSNGQMIMKVADMMQKSLGNSGLFITSLGASMASTTIVTALKTIMVQSLGYLFSYYKGLNSKLSFKDFMLIFGGIDLALLPMNTYYLYDAMKHMAHMKQLNDVLGRSSARGGGERFFSEKHKEDD